MPSDFDPLLEDDPEHVDRAPVGFELTDGDPTGRVSGLLERGLRACNGDRGSRHDAMTSTIAGLVRLAEQGEPGVAVALAELRGAFAVAVAVDRGGLRKARREFDDLVTGALPKIAATTSTPTVTLKFVPLAEFAAVDEPGAQALAGDGADALIPANGDVMVYGDGGAGKTTLVIDFACHFAAGEDWLGIPIAQALNVLIVENEGPRALFRSKLRGKLAGWTGPELDGRLHICEEPWAGFTFASEAHRAELARQITEHGADVVVVGPLAASGMNEAGTLQEVRAFLALCADVRRRSGRNVTFILIHHENKGGKVSGAWEGCGDTLLHVTGKGPGRTRLYVQKARWASTWHARTLELRWADGEGFEVEAKPEISDDDIAERILAGIGNDPGTGWTKVGKAITGVRDDRKIAVRDRLLSVGRVVNVAGGAVLNRCEEGKRSHLYPAGDPSIPTVPQLIPGPESVGQRWDQTDSAGGARS